jgi:hypothetical protein
MAEKKPHQVWIKEGDFLPGCGSGAYNSADALSDLESILPRPFLLLPLYEGKKNPSLKDWADLTSIVQQDHAHRMNFRGQAGIGLVCGAPSGGLCLIDIDRDELVPVYEERHPQLETASRVIGARGCKWLVRTAAESSGFALKDDSGRRVGEFLGRRQQGVVAGLHPDTGMPYRWEIRKDIPVIDPRLFDPRVIRRKSITHPNNP